MFLILGLTESRLRETEHNFLYIFVIGSNCPQLVYIGIATLTSVDLSIFSQSKNLVCEVLSFSLCGYANYFFYYNMLIFLMCNSKGFISLFSSIPS